MVRLSGKQIKINLFADIVIFNHIRIKRILLCGTDSSQSAKKIS